jgi:hypothetical protein
MRVTLLVAGLGAGLLAWTLSLGGNPVLTAQQQSALPSGAGNLEGGWVRLDTAGSGSFGDLTSKFTPAVLTPEGATNLKPQRDPDDVDADNKPHKAGEPYIVTQGRCGVGGPGGVEPNSAALFITPTRDEVLITREGPGGRHIYTDGRAHPDVTRIVPSGAGHSTGRWDGSDFVVDTVGLSTGAVTAGGWRTPETHLTERYHIAPDGTHLTITFTWTDPKIYQKSHTYTFEFERLPGGSYAFENWCDSGDPLQRQSVVPPEQLP